MRTTESLEIDLEDEAPQVIYSKEGNAKKQQQPQPQPQPQKFSAQPLRRSQRQVSSKPNVPSADDSKLAAYFEVQIKKLDLREREKERHRKREKTK